MLLASRCLIFEDFRFNVPTRELLRVENKGAVTPIALGSRAADLLHLFLQRPGELLAKRLIMDTVWPNAAVEESNLTVQLSALRRALDGGRSGASCIQTVPGRGYRFTPQVIDADESEAVSPLSGIDSPAPDAARPSPEEFRESPLSVAAAPSPQPVPASSSRSPVAGRRVGKWRLLGAGIFALLCAAGVAVHSRELSTEEPTERAAPPRLSIVVLPFANSSGEPKDDEVAAAVTEDVTTSLAQMPGSFVVARSIAQAMATRKLLLPAIGRELGVRYVLEANIRRSPDAVVLKVQLSDAASGASIWTRQFQTSTSEPGDVSSQIGQSLLFPLRTAFMDAEVRRLSRLPAAALTAADLLLQVRASYNHEPIGPARNAENIATLERVLALEPNSAEIMIRLARANLRSVNDYANRDGDYNAHLVRASSLADRARALAGGSEDMLALQAIILREKGRYDEAIAAFTALMQAHPKTVSYYQWKALCLMAIGRSEEALPLLHESIKLDRGATARHILYGNLGRALVRLGRSEEAISWLLAARENSSGFSPQINRWLAIAYAHSGKVEDARREFREVAKQLTTSTVRLLRHKVWPTPAAAEEMKREIDGLAIAGMRDHVDEDADTGLPITAGLPTGNMHAPTPLGAPGVSTIRTSELSALVRRQESGMADGARPLVLSTMCPDCLDIAFSGAINVPASLRPTPMNDGQHRSLKTWVDKRLGGNPSRRIIVISWNAEWWYARNLAMELAALGYPNVSWYRGGLEAWDTAGLPVTRRN